ncbi:hypothetical protein EDB83DRAFT_361810 [Lactarius deliciosus]|nr:hypothetical protein EDB83DRAFT_361810 [Lactarius deliciosus]
MPVNSSQANSRKCQQRVIDAQIRALVESVRKSVRTLKLHRNALAPISSLPTEVITTIFSFLRASSSFAGNCLAWLRVAHVCHRWREIALNQPLLWSHVDFTTLTLTGAAEMLSRAKMVPLHLEARVPVGRWDDSRFSAFQNELHARISHICHLAISAEPSRLHRTLEGLTSPAPTLEYLSLSVELAGYVSGAIGGRGFVPLPDTLFDGTTPKLSSLELRNCNINWKSLLLRGLKHLDIRMSSELPSLSVWLDALDGMPQLKTLVLHSASPIPLIPLNVERTITLPFLTYLDIFDSVESCGLALAHLVLPALACLCVAANSRYPEGSDMQKLLPYVTRHAHGPQDTQPLQSMRICGERNCVDIVAWLAPDIDVKVDIPRALLAATRSARLMLTIDDWSFPNTRTDNEVLDAVMAALPLDGLVTLTARYRTQFYEEFWLRHAPRWPLLQHVRLAPCAAHGFREMVLQDNCEWERPLFPSLTRLDLIDNSALSERRTLRLCGALMKRVEQGIPLEVLNLRECIATDHAVRLLDEIVVDVLGPEQTFKTRAQIFSTWDSGARGYFVRDYNSELEDYEEGDSDTDSEDQDSEDWGIYYENDSSDVPVPFWGIDSEEDQISP